jgi:predicted nucleic acid-binding protein
MAATAVLDTTILSHLARNEVAVTTAFGAWLDAGNGIVIATRNRKDFDRIAGVRPRLAVHTW